MHQCFELEHHRQFQGFHLETLNSLTLFQLCIEHNVNVMQNEYQVVCIFNGNNFINEHWYENYKDHATKEAATCAAMWAALCKLKGIE